MAVYRQCLFAGLGVFFVYRIFQYIQGADRTLKPDLCGILSKVLSDMKTKAEF